MAYYGTITRWLDDKGYGFIQRQDTKGEVFFHISDCPATGVRPQLGWLVSFELKQGRDGKAAACQIQGKGFAASRSVRPARQPVRPKTSFSHILLATAVVAGLGYFGYQRYQAHATIAAADAILSQQTSPLEPASQHQFSCDGRQHCSQMRSKEEALYFLQHCPDTKMDGDHDGDPCEQQF
ncbi:cold shock domain-containing protein [Vogesella oryzae]|uniref:cold shock domain-containing protein n=1 Tax=Vogesella oryzae TaxID=1735285 RepID=UPI0015832956|nr:cold shock domain-containing protein [Vogesella oryzae]